MCLIFHITILLCKKLGGYLHHRGIFDIGSKRLLFSEVELLNILRLKYIIPGVVLSLMLSIALSMTFTTAQALDSGDPFGATQKGTSPNCGPEYRLKLDIAVSSTAKFIEILRNIESYIGDHEIRQWVKSDSFKKTGSAEVDWKALEATVKISAVADRTIYSVDYTPYGCYPSQKFTIKITNDGHMSLYGCCGK